MAYANKRHTSDTSDDEDDDGRDASFDGRRGSEPAGQATGQGSDIAAATATASSAATATRTATATAAAREVKLDKNGQPKKKRKQLVACDSCRLRRVKCDKSETGSADCSECAKKGINCTDTYVRSKPKVVRGGKLIQQAKKLYGGGSGNENGQSDDGGAPVAGAYSNEDGGAGLLGTHPSPGRDSDRPSRSPLPLPVIHRAPEGRMVDAQVSLALADHLVQIYLQTFQMQCHLVDWQAFSKRWDEAGRDSSRMSPTNECLALAIQAWGARFSDHPLVLGISSSNSPSSSLFPKREREENVYRNISSPHVHTHRLPHPTSHAHGNQDDAQLPTLASLRSDPNRGDLTQMGNRREAFARGMLGRALDKMDQNGAWRTPSAAGCAALLLVEFLVTWSNSIREPAGSGAYMMHCVAQHLRAMADFSTYRSDDPSEDPQPPERISGGTLLWMCYTRDALSAALAGRPCSLSPEDLACFSDLLAVEPNQDEILSSVSSDIPPLLSGLGVVSTFRHLTTAIRDCTISVTGPLARRRRLDEVAVQRVWQEIDNSMHYGAVFRASVDRADWGPEPPKSDAWFRDLTVMQGQLTLAIHRALEDRLDKESRAAAAAAAAGDAGATRGAGVDAEGLERAKRIKRHSDVRLLDAGRALAGLLRSYGSEIATRVTLGAEYIVPLTQHMMDMPAAEQGGPPGWTFGSKQMELSWMIDALRYTGWCWAGRDVVMRSAKVVVDDTANAERHYRQSTFGGGGGGVSGHDTSTGRSSSSSSRHAPHLSPIYPLINPLPSLHHSQSTPLAHQQPSAAPDPTSALVYGSTEFSDSHLGHNPAFSTTAANLTSSVASSASASSAASATVGHSPPMSIPLPLQSPHDSEASGQNHGHGGQGNGYHSQRPY